MFTTENSLFTSEQLDVVNAAAERLLADRINADTSDEDRAQIAKGVADAVNNAWVEGATVDELVATVDGWTNDRR